MVAPTKRTMSKEHKAALAAGRLESNAVKAYLEALDAHAPKRGRRRTPEAIKKRLDTIAESINGVNALQALQMVQERMDLEAELNSMDNEDDLKDAEKAFLKVAKDFSERRGISHAAWREMGVPADVCRQAGI